VRWRKKSASQNWWRVQASWTVGGEPRGYEPVFCEGREAADRTAEEIAATLRHFPTLEVVVAPATADEVEAQGVESQRRAAKPPEPVHLMDEVRPGETACGAMGNAIALDLWHLSGGPKCPACDAIAASSLR
jgi:hypothetical protein